MDALDARDDEALTGGSRPKRTDNACRGCRERKVKCNGAQPCSTCIRRHQECVFELEERKVFVSRRYLAELKRKSTSSQDNSEIPSKRRRASLDDGEQEPPSGVTRDATSPEPVPSAPLADETIISNTKPTGGDGHQISNTSPNIRNLLASRPSAFVTDGRGRRRFLGPTSTWGYTHQVINLIKKHLRNHESPKVPLNPEGPEDILQWPSTGAIGPLSLSMLPSLDFALHLTSTVKFHLGQLYHIFHEKSFVAGLHKFYDHGPYTEPLPGDRLWYVQYLLLMAFGHALLSGYVGRKPAGSELVSRAIELMPDAFGLNQDPVLATEVLCCLALYLQSIDHRNSAFIYIGQAVNMALSQGLHRELFGDEFTEEDKDRHYGLWWTIYILDRRFSTMMGAPSSIRDEDITVPLPDYEKNCHFMKAMSLQVPLARLHAQVLSSIYSSDTYLRASYLENTRQVLKGMADLTSNLKQTFGMQFDNDGPISRASATLNLYYHQCIVLSTRPLLLCSLRRLLTGGSLEITEPIKALLRAAQDSAARSLRILTALHSQRLLENFLPFDLESTFSSAFVLSLMAALPACPLEDTADVDASFFLLNQMVAKGNIIAEFRRQDLEHLINLLHLVGAEISQRNSLGTNAIPPVSGGAEYDQTLPSHIDDVGAFNDLSPEQMLSLAGLLELDPTFDHVDEQWLWA
ncbi:fungal-specific transcription factor domain-containing protein [Xylaria arbuscula]|nr:fungal-specific transcription factor domain-containing protein [Xylaria arbuscula]